MKRLVRHFENTFNDAPMFLGIASYLSNSTMRIRALFRYMYTDWIHAMADDKSIGGLRVPSLRKNSYHVTSAVDSNTQGRNFVYSKPTKKVNRDNPLSRSVSMFNHKYKVNEKRKTKNKNATRIGTYREKKKKRKN